MTLPLAAGTWTVDPTHSSVNFNVRHMGLAKVRGTFESFTASVSVGETLADSRVEATVDLSSVDTGNADRDAHLRGSDFFDADSRPTMKFVSTSIAGSGDEYQLTGELTIGDITRETTLDVEFFGTETFPMDQSLRAGFSASGTISRKEFGVEFDVPLGGDKLMIGDKVAIELDIQLVAPTA